MYKQKKIKLFNLEIEENEYGNIRILDLYKPSHADETCRHFHDDVTDSQFV